MKDTWDDYFIDKTNVLKNKLGITDNKVLEDKKEEVDSTPLVSIDASKYINNEEMGFIVTEGNKTYDLSDSEFDVVVAVVSTEFDKNLNDALGVVSVILNRCDSDKWVRWAGASPYDQVIKKGQFEVYFYSFQNHFVQHHKKYKLIKLPITLLNNLKINTSYFISSANLYIFWV